MNILSGIVKFLLGNPNFALFIANLLLVIVTFLYVFYTKKMAKMMVKQADETKRMADIMVREYELKVSPLIELRLRSLTGGGKIDISLFNRGTISVTIKRILLECRFTRSDRTKSFEFKNEVEKILSPEEPIHHKFGYAVNDIVKSIKNEFPECTSIADGNLLNSVVGELCAYYINIKGDLQRTIPVKVPQIF